MRWSLLLLIAFAAAADVRMALGADPSTVGRVIFGGGMRLALLGLLSGIAGAYARREA